MRKPVAVAAGAALLLGALQVPASAAAPVAPTDVQLSRVDGVKQSARLTWKDGGEKNYIGYQLDGTEPDPDKLITDVDGDNDVVVKIPVDMAYQKKVRLLVWSRDAAGTITEWTPTEWFDTQLAVPPVVRTPNRRPTSR